MKQILLFTTLCAFFLGASDIFAQDEPVAPSVIGTGVYHGLTPPLRDLPVLTEGEMMLLYLEGLVKNLNPKLEKREYPYYESSFPKEPDQAWQKEQGKVANTKALVMNFNGQTSPYYPPDANGTVGHNYYMQTINIKYTIYDKTSGAVVAGPTALNQLFDGVTGSGNNDGDPIILYDEDADRWLVTEISISGSGNDYILMAVSTTNDPTGEWHKYSFSVSKVPDYPKFGIWRDGYYMGTNTSPGQDIYVFERSKMLIGEPAQIVGFNNPWRPTTIDGFMCVPPIDNDGPLADAGTPGLFITINDDAIGGGDDELWIYELDVNWSTPANSTFTRTQQVAVTPFDSNFGNNWNNIKQQGTSQELDAIPMVIMNKPQYRNFGSHETILCNHTVDVDASDHAGIRWYELRRTTGNWEVRQTGTYAPDEHSRWMGSIALNGTGEIGLGYSISSSSMYPGIRYCGQSATAYAAATGNMDIAEEVIHDGTNKQTSFNRWGDYSNISIDPDDDHTFWFTSQHGGSRKTKIASFEFAPQPLTADFTAEETSVSPGTVIQFTNLSSGAPTSWSWEFEGGSPENSTDENPSVTYNATGEFDVTLTVTDDPGGSDTKTILEYIVVADVPGCSTPVVPLDGATDVAVDQYLEWSGVPGATGYKISLATINPVIYLANGLDVGNITAFIPPGNLDFNTTYYWRVDPYNAVGDAVGCSVWSFTTESSTGSYDQISYDSFETSVGNWLRGGADCLAHLTGTYASHGNHAANIQDNSGVSSSFYTKNGIDVHTANYVQIDVKFDFIPVGMDNSDEDFWLQYYDGSTWYTVATYAFDTDFQNGNTYEAKVNIFESDYAFPTGMKIRFMCDASTNSDDIYIDQIEISASTTLIPDSYLILKSASKGHVAINEEILFYPNPVHSLLNIRTAMDNNSMLRIYNLTGELLYSEKLTGDYQTIDVSHLPNGMYIVYVTGNGDTFTEKIIKK